MAHKEDPDSWLIKRNRDEDTHIEACSTGYLHGRPFGDWYEYSNIHHVVSITCMADGTIEDLVKNDKQFKFIKNCLAMTKWDINDNANTVGLPKKPAYVDKRAPQTWDGWACHQVDHDLYITAVNTRLKSKVWNACQDVAQNCKLKGEQIAKQLKKESEYWLDDEDEGLGNRKTAAAWKTKKKVKQWYLPFSMYVPGARERKAPPDWADDFKPSMWNKLGELLAAVTPP